MKQEDKDLVLRELCKMVPYDTKVLVKIDGERAQTLTWVRYATETIGVDYSGHVLIETPCYDNYSQNVFPYLRPMSSMTEKEKWELVDLCDFYRCYCDTDDYSHYGIEIISQYCVNDKLIPEDIVSCRAIDWLYAHHFDIRGLIEKGLAIAVTEDNDPYE